MGRRVDPEAINSAMKLDNSILSNVSPVTLRMRMLQRVLAENCLDLGKRCEKTAFLQEKGFAWLRFFLDLMGNWKIPQLLQFCSPPPPTFQGLEQVGPVMTSWILANSCFMKPVGIFETCWNRVKPRLNEWDACVFRTIADECLAPAVRPRKQIHGWQDNSWRYSAQSLHILLSPESKKTMVGE